jgi:hypothetical protein
MRKIQFYKILFLICFWLFCAIFITFYDASVLGFKSEIEGEHYSFLRNLIYYKLYYRCNPTWIIRGIVFK